MSEAPTPSRFYGTFDKELARWLKENEHRVPPQAPEPQRRPEPRAPEKEKAASTLRAELWILFGLLALGAAEFLFFDIALALGAVPPLIVFVPH